jgi:SanA protein
MQTSDLRIEAPVRLLRFPGGTRGALGVILAGLILLLAAVAGIQWQIRETTREFIYSSPEDAPSRPVALVFGAGVVRNRYPSPILRERIRTAADLYKAGKVKKLLMTGDNGSLDYNEVAVMRRVAAQMGVPKRDIVNDHAGFRTYDSCYRARDVFEVRSAILVTQAFHQPRAVYLARRMGIDAVGVDADQSGTDYRGMYRWREVLARTVAWIQVNVTHPRPRYLGPKIPVMEVAGGA